MNYKCDMYHYKFVVDSDYKSIFVYCKDSMNNTEYQQEFKVNAVLEHYSDGARIGFIGYLKQCIPIIKFEDTYATIHWPNIDITHDLKLQISKKFNN